MITYWFNENTVSRLLEQRATDTPNGVAFQREAEDGTWQPTLWHEFAARVDALARAMHTSGLRKGDRLALIAPVSLEWELLHHAALAMGLVVVGLDAHDLPERLAVMVEQADVTAFVVSDTRVLSKVRAERLIGCRFLLALGSPLGAMPNSQRWLSLDAFEAMSSACVARPAAPSPDDFATIIFTSGTTGAPKGIAYRHDQVCLAVEAIRDAFSFVSADGRLLCWLPLSNLFQRMVSLAGLRQGAATYLLADPRRVMQVVARVSPDIFVGVPRFYEKLYDGLRDTIAAMPPLKQKLVAWAWAIGRHKSLCQRENRRAPHWLSGAYAVADRVVLARMRNVMGTRLRFLVTGSAPMPKHLMEEFHALGWVLLEAYGLSENVMPMTMNQPDAYRLGSVGRPMPGNELTVAADGTVMVRGPCMFSGYLDNADPPPFDPEGYYSTADLGNFDPDGYLHLTGRSGDLIKTSTGRRISPTGVEEQLRRVPGVDQAVLIGSGRKFLMALCTTANGPLNSATFEQMKTALQMQVSTIYENERPVGIALIERPFSVDRRELTPNLKLRRAAIEEIHAATIQRLLDEIYKTPAPMVGRLAVIIRLTTQ